MFDLAQVDLCLPKKFVLLLGSEQEGQMEIGIYRFIQFCLKEKQHKLVHFKVFCQFCVISCKMIGWCLLIFVCISHKDHQRPMRAGQCSMTPGRLARLAIAKWPCGSLHRMDAQRGSLELEQIC